MPETPVCLLKADSYADPDLPEKIHAMLDACAFPPLHGKKILVKPNLLQPKILACAEPVIVASVCAWLKDQGARITVADSPGFGRAPAVARAIGLEEKLKPLGLRVSSLNKPRKVSLPLPDNLSESPVSFAIASQALDSDRILSIARVKAHSQMRITLTVKNCYGCVPGLRKALYHARYGASTAFFAACLAALWNSLPPISGILDGITAMTGTGPSKGSPFPMHILGASISAAALDKAILETLHISSEIVPLQKALGQYPEKLPPKIIFPFEKPENFHIDGYIVPQILASASFNPARLLKSCLKRIWKSI